MIKRMKSDISSLKNASIGKEINRYTIAPMFVWALVWILNKTQKNYIVGEIALAIMFFAFLFGCITALIARKNKMIFILFKVISIWMVSLGLLSISYTSYYIFLNIKGISFVCVTLFLYVSIFIGMLIIVRNKVKPKEKIKQKSVKKNKKILLSSTIFFVIGCFIIGPIVNKSSQATMHVVLICLGTLISYILVACSPYYLVEYMISKK